MKVYLQYIPDMNWMGGDVDGVMGIGSNRNDPLVNKHVRRGNSSDSKKSDTLSIRVVVSCNGPFFIRYGAEYWGSVNKD